MLLVNEVSYDVPCPGDAGILSVDAMTGDTTVFFDDGCGGVLNIHGIAADPVGQIYAADNQTTPPNVFRIESPTSATPVVATPPFADPRRIRFNSQGDLFVADTSGNTIYIVQDGTDEAQPFITNVEAPRAMLLDGDAIYFSEDTHTPFGLPCRSH